MPEKNKKYTVKITDTAWEMLMMHVRFLSNVSLPAADRLIDLFVETTDSLSSWPERYPWLENKAISFQKYRKVLIGKHYMALYEIQGNVVYISAVVDCRQDNSWLL